MCSQTCPDDCPRSRCAQKGGVMDQNTPPRDFSGFPLTGPAILGARRALLQRSGSKVSVAEAAPPDEAGDKKEA